MKHEHGMKQCLMLWRSTEIKVLTIKKWSIACLFLGVDTKIRFSFIPQSGKKAFKHVSSDDFFVTVFFSGFLLQIVILFS